ncbi:MAG: thioredoxin family protein [Bacilli bacterium]|nr:thioredoxin family protein [Bacilli bacterium]
MKKLVALLLTFLLVITGCTVTKVEDETETDAIKFNKEYPSVSKDNVYKYATYNNVIDTIENGSGIIYLGFPTCPWCKQATPVLNESAKNRDVKEILYYNFKDIRENNTEEYQRLVSLLSDYIGKDTEGNKRIGAPTVVFVQNGKIKGVHVDTVEGHDASKRKMTEEETNNLKQIYTDLIDMVYNDECDC